MRDFTLTSVATLLGQTSESSQKIRRFQQDSRQVMEGDLFFAVKGEKVDGHDFLKDVAAKGALGAVVSREYQGDSYGLHLIFVRDVLIALQSLAKTVFNNRTTQVVAVTGSAGKTTTKEFIATLLEGKFKTAKTPGN